MLKINAEIIEKAKQAKSVDDLLILAKEHDITLTEEDANEFFKAIGQEKGELSDEELDNVAGGGCRGEDGMLLVTPTYKCSLWEDKLGHRPRELGVGCSDCKWIFTVKLLSYCSHPENMK